jgi:hypothetical protein
MVEKKKGNKGLKEETKSGGVYFLDIDNKMAKKLEKLDRSNPKLFKRVHKKILRLEKYPFPENPKHILFIEKNIFYCELGVDKVRIYYLVARKEIVICKIKYYYNC